MSQHIGSDIRKSSGQLRAFLITVKSENNIMDVGPVNSPIRWLYHAATLVSPDMKRWGIIDPVLFPDTEIHSFDEWASRLGLEKGRRLYFSPVE